MKKFKKVIVSIISIVLLVAMVLPLFVHAEEAPTEQETAAPANNGLTIEAAPTEAVTEPAIDPNASQTANEANTSSTEEIFVMENEIENSAPQSSTILLIAGVCIAAVIGWAAILGKTQNKNKSDKTDEKENKNENSSAK